MTAASDPQAPAQVEEVTVTIDGVEVSVPKGTLVIRAAEQVGIEIPRFCDHPLLKPAGACRQCLVEVSAPRNGELTPFPKPQTSCTLEVTDGMQVSTQNTSAVAEKAQVGQIEFLLVNHPLDCPVCDKGGECPLQNQAYSHGSNTSRFTGVKRTFPKPIKVSSQILLDRDRCILCQRCTRFADEIAGDPFIDLQGRGGGTPGYDVHGLHGQQIGRFDEGILDFEGGQTTFEDDVVGPHGEASLVSATEGSAGTVAPADEDASGRPFASYFSGNTIQICPVGALTSASYRFRSRPFDLVSSPAIAEHDACGAAIRVDHRRGMVMRRLAGDDPAVNEEWVTDKDRFAHTWQNAPDVLEAPLVRDEETGELVPTSWSEAVHLAARHLMGKPVGALPGGRLTVEDAYAWSKFTRVVLGSNDVDFRARAHSSEEADYLGAVVAGSSMDITFTDLESTSRVLLVGLEPEEEAGTIFLRLRKGVLAGRVAVSTIAPLATAGTTKLRAEHIPAAPGQEAQLLRTLAAGSEEHSDLVAALQAPGAIILAGERLAHVAGGLTALEELRRSTGARVAWVPRRAGDRGAVEVGLLPGLLPGGRPVAEESARAEAAAVWGTDVPAEPGRDLDQILTAAAEGELTGLLVGGVDLEDLPDVALAERALQAAHSVVQLEVRRSAVTAHADVVLPVAPPTGKGGTYLNWEGRPRPFEAVFDGSAMSDATVLDMVADACDRPISTRTLTDIHREIAEFGTWQGPRHRAPEAPPAESPQLGDGQVVLATWHLMLDGGRCQDGEPHLAGTARKPVALLSPATAERAGIAAGGTLRLSTETGTLELPAAPTAMPDSVVWVPQRSPGSLVHRSLGVGAGAVVSLTASEVS
ncbi:MAG TPA: NADH-quinone oxidoreductase subunit G [Ruania sp.]|nr:NADH-quinone oxidoreductase subunit G [Ruania sp.]